MVSKSDVDFFVVAAEVATHATCYKARCGSVIVSADGEVIGSGFNAPPLNDELNVNAKLTMTSPVNPNLIKPAVFMLNGTLF